MVVGPNAFGLSGLNRETFQPSMLKRKRGRWALACPDVPSEDQDEYYYDAVMWAAENDMIAQDAAFGPYAPCTRLTAVEYMWKYAGSPAAADAGFADIASDAVNWAVEQEITNGTGADTFSPDDTCTRAEIVTFLYRGFGE